MQRDALSVLACFAVALTGSKFSEDSARDSV
jgi:hypothetical protein